jgi:alkanesulfonate monooxygenase SsuD/methylene tetrahydromethanopterin reductase-like flavin-dependent oxidoreductase (luciferase family)
MTDYGHGLRFGTFLTPASARPGQVVELARLSDRLGYDLISFQDHPYQPALLDAPTLLAYVAAQTEHAHLSANVTNLPLRQPVIIARSAVTLDLLSGGRFELGIGAGAFWDAIEAVGGRRLTPGQSVSALAEAIEVIRAIWAVDEPGGVRLPGEFYRVVGAKRGPAAAHRIGISMGAYGPRMLRLTGHVADGWLPSLGYLGSPGDLAGMNARIDEGAVSAGRAPADIRRWLNFGGSFGGGSGRSGLFGGSAALWAEQLAALALAYGMSGFILGSDDAATIERFAAEVIPAVRETVAAARGVAAAGGEAV